MQRGLLHFVFSLLLLFTACQKEVPVEEEQDHRGAVIQIHNRTGGLQDCGEATTVLIEFSFASDQEKILVEPRARQSVYLDIEMDELVNIKVKRADGNSLITEFNQLVKQKNTDATAFSLQKTITICPAGTLTFTNF
ncbi:MAG: hypothetical protein AAFO94_00180 [Bacteroidota bacterium]